MNSTRRATTFAMAALCLARPFPLALAQDTKGSVVYLPAQGLAPGPGNRLIRAEIWYLSVQRWTDATEQTLESCVFPEIQIKGSGQWTLGFELRLRSLKRSMQPAEPFLEVRVPTPIDAPSIVQLKPGRPWCITTQVADGPLQLMLETNYGRARVVFSQPQHTVKFPR